LAGILLFVEKICQRDALFWLGLWVVGISYSRAVIHLEHSSAEKMAVLALLANCDPNRQEIGFIFHEAAQNFEPVLRI
jgi:hypothetical protein